MGVGTIVCVIILQCNWMLHVSKSKHGTDVFYVNASLKWTDCPQKRIVGIFISSCLIKQRLWARCCFVYCRYQGNRFISATAEKSATSWQRLNLHFQKAYFMFRSMPNCAYRPMFLHRKHRVVNVKEVNLPSKNRNNLDRNIYVLNLYNNSCLTYPFS